MGNNETHRFRYAGAEVAYWISGTPSDVEFVLVHGIGMGRRVFDQIAEALEPHGVVFALDLPGFGESPEPETALSMEASGDFLAAFVRSVSASNPVLVGHSMGTQVVAEAIAQQPDISTRAVLIAPVVNPAEKTAIRQGLRLVQDLADERLRVLVIGLYYYLKAGPRWFVKKLRQMLDHDIEAVLPNINAHTLVLRGVVDKVCPHYWVQQVADLIPHSRFEEIEGCGHEAMLRRPDPITALILEHAAQQPGEASP
ncbi:MAG: alpha/beta fold hydrolase [Gulosibacter sp.]|uniref:alpha/beta fold hydrolase n=1 Tax=Gulosibacter sp. TaxID=2817531 RepID=UPI003F934A29